VSAFEASQDLLNIYIEDARSHLEALDHSLLALEREGFDHEQVSAVLGPLHTLKGNSGMIGFGRIQDYVHRLEDVFVAIDEARLPLEPALFDTLFAGASALRDAVERACAEKGEVRDLLPEKAALEGLIAPAPAAPSLPAQKALAAKPAPQAAAGKPAPSEQYVSARSSTVRVDFAQLDQLLNLVGELIIYRTKLQELAHDAAEQAGGRGSAAHQLVEALQQVQSASSQLQETVMDLRMLPVRHVFERFPRLVRDLARQQGKDVELILEGQHTRVDKAIIDEIGEPLVHMIRNAIDHGIETPQERIRRGKTPTGTILMAAAQESNQVVITMMDDGGGIDADQVRRKAIERGLVQEDQLLSDREAIQFVFAQGFSTKGAVTDLSGRGVGLDVVLKSIERLNGMVEVETVPGVGTKFIIQLPLTLAIISALLVELGERVFAIPLGSVVESLRVDAHAVHRINGRETLRLREKLIPLHSLAELFGLPQAAASQRRYAVILGRGDKRIGLVVDGLRGQQQVVIKALDPAVSGAAFAIAGATIMGDGRVVLIVDVAALFDTRRHERGALRAG
jgi:two-component system chemotaxis sensor kinase CheA